MDITIVVAVHEKDNKFIIGQDGKIPWRSKRDLRWFKDVTSNKSIVMGRKTFESIGKPLPNRTNIILSRNSRYTPQGELVLANNLDQAMNSAINSDKFLHKQNEIIIAGGSEIYKEFLDKCNKMYITYIKGDYEGNEYFPNFDESLWQEDRVANFAEELNDPEHSIVRYIRK